MASDIRNYEELYEGIKLLIKNLLNFEIPEHEFLPSHSIDSTTILILEAILFNLMLKIGKKEEAMNNSRMGKSNISASSEFGRSSIISITDMKREDVRNFQKLLELMSNDQEFWDLLKNLAGENPSSIKSLILQEFLLTFDFLLNKFRVSNNYFHQQKAYYEKFNISKSLIAKEELLSKEEIRNVNEILFSDKIVQIRKIFSFNNNYDLIQFSGLRILFANYSLHPKGQSRFFAGCKFYGKDIIFTLFKRYINDEQRSLDGLFRLDVPGQKGKFNADPVFWMILYYMQCLFLPVFLDFHTIFDALLTNLVAENGDEFFEKSQSVLENEMTSFFKNLPSEFNNFFYELNVIVEGRKKRENKSSTFPLKTLLLQRFLLDTNLKVKMGLCNVGDENYLKAANWFKDLFYPSTSKKYKCASFHSLQALYLELYKEITETFYDTSSQVLDFYLPEPLLINDYVALKKAIKEIHFEPEDMKSYPIEGLKTNNPIRKIYSKRMPSMRIVEGEKASKTMLESSLIKSEFHISNISNNMRESVVKSDRISNPKTPINDEPRPTFPQNTNELSAVSMAKSQELTVEIKSAIIKEVTEINDEKLSLLNLKLENIYEKMNHMVDSSNSFRSEIYNHLTQISNAQKSDTISLREKIVSLERKNKELNTFISCLPPSNSSVTQKKQTQKATEKSSRFKIESKSGADFDALHAELGTFHDEKDNEEYAFHYINAVNLL